MPQPQFYPQDKAAFAIEENGQRVAEMVVGITGKQMAVYHTGVLEQMQGRSLGKQLVQAMSAYAKEQGLQVVVFCPFVLAVFRKDPEQYKNIWQPGKPRITEL